MPWYQGIFVGISAILVGLTALGALLDALGNANMISLRLAIFFTLLILAAWVLTEIIAHYRGIRWQTGRREQFITIKRLSTRSRLIILGVVALLWAPQVIPGLGGPDDTPPAKPPTGRLIQERLLAGVVWDEDNGPLAGAEVSLPTHGMTMTSDAWGRFEFRVHAPQETVTLMARKAGYLPQTQDATLGNPELSVTLRKRP
jgi:hypothetical protein